MASRNIVIAVVGLAALAAGAYFWLNRNDADRQADEAIPADAVAADGSAAGETVEDAALLEGGELTDDASEAVDAVDEEGAFEESLEPITESEAPEDASAHSESPAAPAPESLR